ncbi:MAG TPA: FIST N-terminal domain-containing protein [Chloroflexota bacterium]|nr:FIST N-terminal domain-containing protein [Chloroflexota bacterium]
MRVETFTSARPRWSAGVLPEFDDADLVLVFAAPASMDAPAPFEDIRRAYPNAQVAGCSTSGEIAGASILDDSISGAVVAFDDARVAVATTHVTSQADSYAAGARLAQELTQSDLKGVFVLSDGLSVNGSELVRGLNSVLSPEVVVTGGLAGDGDRFQRTWVLEHGLPASGVVSAVGVYGERVKLGHGSRGGWDLFGPERRVTRSESNKVYELDGKPALELYKAYLGDLAAELPASAFLFPLSLRLNASDEKRLIRTVLGIDEAEQSLTFAGDIPTGSLVQLTRGNFDRLIDGASDAAAIAAEPLRGPSLSIAVSCVGRRLVLGERTEEELEAALDLLPEGTKQVGFYSYGEISPFGTGYCDLHNQTMTLTTFGES